MPTPTRSPFVCITEPDIFRHTFERLLEELGRQPQDQDRVVHRIEGLLLLLHRQPDQQNVAPSRRDQLLSLMRHIEEFPGEMIDFHRHAKHMGITVSHLRRLFGMVAGCPPKAYVNRIRMNHAALILRTSDRPIKQIATDIGLDDVYYFSKLFLRQHGLPPATYRRSFQRLGTE
jgi:AraC-like DNA-binding protein